MPSAESSNIVPTLTVNCFLQSLQYHRRRVEINECSVDWQRGHATLPLCQRNRTAYWNVRSGSEKNTIASCKVLGSRSVFAMSKVSHKPYCVSSILSPMLLRAPYVLCFPYLRKNRGVYPHAKMSARRHF